MAKTLSMVAYNLSTLEAEQMDLWEFKASLINITNFKIARVHVSKTIQKARKSTVTEQDIPSLPNASSSWQPGPRRRRKRQTRLSYPTCWGGHKASLAICTLPSIPDTPRGKTRGVLSLRSKSSSCSSGTAPTHSAVSKSRMQSSSLLSHLEAFSTSDP